ncbi:MAG: hypothetical protein WCP53_13225 [Verrucomicrobiota bacterium]
MERPFVPCVVAFLALILWGSCACDEKEREERQQTSRQISQLQEDAQRAQSHAVEVERRRDQDRRVLLGQKEEAREDTSAAITMWLASSIALAVVILLLAREAWLRGVLQRFVRRLLQQREEPP